MRFLLAAALAVSFCGAAFAQAEDSRPQLQDQLIAVAAAQGYGIEGSQFGLDQGVPEGKSVRYAFALKAGETYFVAGGCDKNCTSLALLMTDANSANVAYTEDGEIVAHTPFDGTVHPSFTITAKKTTTYSIVINVAGCRGPQSMCVAGAAVFHAGAPVEKGWIRTDDFTIDPKGTIVVSDDFSDEMFCVMDTIDDNTAAAGAAALEAGEWPDDVAGDFGAAVGECSEVYDWSDAEKRQALVVSTTQVLLNSILDRIESAGLNYDDVGAIQGSLTNVQNAKFGDGSWLQDSEMVARIVAGLKEHGLRDEPALITAGETAVGTFGNQLTAIREWVGLLTPK